MGYKTPNLRLALTVTLMSQDIEQYGDIIEQLKPMVNEPDFNQILSQVASNVPKQKRFLLKMELKRLARPCQRVIDLRGRVDGECELYEHEGVSHFLDEVAREAFEQQIRSFGQYTIGVYEAVNNTENNFRVMHQKEKDAPPDTPLEKDAQESEKIESYLVPSYCFAKSTSRKEERMNFAISIELFSDINQSIRATTIDLSVSGIRFKTEDKHLFKPGEKYTIFLRGLESEYSLDRKEGVAYKVVKTERGAYEQRICLQRDLDVANAEFDAFLNRFIHGNKRRYKVNIDNTLQAIKNKTYEQYYIPNFTSIPVYIEQVGEHFRSRFVLTNDSNKEYLFYWADERNQLQLEFLLNSRRLTQAIKGKISEFYVYAFNNVSQNAVFFYSASDFELEGNKDMRNVFHGFGSRKASWRVFKIQLTTMKSSQCYRPLSIPDAVSEKIRSQNEPPPPRLMAKLKNLRYVALVTDITDATATHAYQRRAVTKQQLPMIKKFAHNRTKNPPTISMFRFKYQNLREENRFQLRTEVLVRYHGQTFKGVTEDVSKSGLCVELSAPFNGTNFAIVELALPKMQAVTKKYDLGGIAYEVRRVSKDKNVINLKSYLDEEDKENGHVGEQFFSDLIKNNKGKLKTYRDEEEIPGIGEALRNIYASNVQNIAFFVKKEGIYLLPDAMTRPILHNRLFNLFTFGCENQETMNSYPLFAAEGVHKQYIQNTLKTLKTNSKPVSRELFVSFDPSQDSPKDAIKAKFNDQFEEDHERREFVVNALGAGQFYAMRIFLARTGRPDTDLLRAELSYVGMYAQHRSKALEEELWAVAGVGDIVDVTDEAMLRFGFTKAHILQNQKPDKNIHLNVH